MGRRKSVPVSAPDSGTTLAKTSDTKISNFGQEFVQPGDNTKYLSHAMTIMKMPPIDLTNPVDVKLRINDYFQLCADNDMKPSVKGLSNALKIGRTTLWEWKQGVVRAGTHQAIILEAYDALEALWEDYMQNGKINPVSGIFLGKNNFGYTDKQEYVLTPNSPSAQVDPATLEEKYADVIEVEE